MVNLKSKKTTTGQKAAKYLIFEVRIMAMGGASVIESQKFINFIHLTL